MNPISDALHDLMSSDEAAFRAAHSGRGLDLEPRARRARRVRAATRAGLVVASAAVLAISAFSVSAALRGDSTDTDPIAPPVPEGYERVVIPLPDEDGWVQGFSKSTDPVFEAAGLYGAICNEPLPDLADAGPFHLEVISTSPGYTGQRPVEGEWIPTDVMAEATLTYNGSSSGVVATDQSAWILLRSDGTIAQSTGGVISSEPMVETNHSLREAFSTEIEGWLPLIDCAAPPLSEVSPEGYPPEVLLDAGSYSIISIAKVEWSAAGATVLDANQLGYDPSWFGEDWRDAVPCRDAVAEAKLTQNGNAIECLPHLYYQQFFDFPSGSQYAIVDVPLGFLDGPRKTWYVVSDPYPFELPLEGEPPTT
ncbi:MAG: hypothetical protein JW722_02450 [Demequinaceae bacterium]|nr:hypothetical protein [Demequinaceae bacterium]